MRENQTKVLYEMYKCVRHIKAVPLPVNRAEFEDRANLFTLLERLQEFLEFKWEFMQSERQG